MFDRNLTIVFGEDWSGKTYTVVHDLYKKYLSGAIVISNMWLAFPHIRVYTMDDLVPILREMQKYHREVITPALAPPSFLLAHDIYPSDTQPREFYVLIDEGLMFANARAWEKNFKDISMLQMISAPRHYQMQITYITKKVQHIDKFLRELALEIIEIRPFFKLWTKLYSHDINRFFIEWIWSSANINPDDNIIDTETHFTYLSKKKDESDFFGWLYYTLEVLWDLAIKHVSHITSIKDYLYSESTWNLKDWRDVYLKKLWEDLLSMWKNIKSVNSEVIQSEFITKKLWDQNLKNMSEKLNGSYDLPPLPDVTIQKKYYKS